MKNSDPRFVIFSNTSRYGTAGLRPQVMWTTDKTIVEAAAWEMNRGGETLEDMAGIEFIEDEYGYMQAEREMTDEEILTFSVEKLGDDGRLYEKFTLEEAAYFIADAERYGLENEARALVAEFNNL